MLTADQIPKSIAVISDALHIMGGQIDWAGLPIVAEMLGISDIERAVRIMRQIIDHQVR